jgi:hypothetical protein
LAFASAYDKLEGRKALEDSSSMAGIVETFKKYQAEIVLAGLYIYVIILGIATLKELGII